MVLMVQLQPTSVKLRMHRHRRGVGTLFIGHYALYTTYDIPPINNCFGCDPHPFAHPQERIRWTCVTHELNHAWQFHNRSTTGFDLLDRTQDL